MFRITIEEMTKVDVTQREWKKIADSGNKQDNGAQYDYATYPDKQTVTVKILEQNVEQVDVKAVVKAVLGI